METHQATAASPSEIEASELGNLYNSGIIENNGTAIDWATFGAWDVFERWETVGLVLNGELVAVDDGTNGRQDSPDSSESHAKWNDIATAYFGEESELSDLYGEIEEFEHCGWDNLDEATRNYKIDALRDDERLVVIENHYESATSGGFSNTKWGRFAKGIDDESSHGWCSAKPIKELLGEYADEILKLIDKEDEEFFSDLYN